MTIPTPTQNLPLTSLEAIWLLRLLRHNKDEMEANLQLVEERLRAGHNGQIAAGGHLITANIDIAKEIIRKLWMLIGPTAGGVPP